MLWTAEQDEASPCEVQENQVVNTGINIFPCVINSGPHPDFKHHGTTDGKPCKLGPFFKPLSLLSAHQKCPEPTLSMSLGIHQIPVR